MTESNEPASYDYREKRTVALISSRIDVATALNVMGHLSMSVGANAGPVLMGRRQLVDGSGIRHTGISRYPIIVKKAKGTQIRRAIAQARTTAGVLVVDYPSEMLTTGHDDELEASLLQRAEADLDYYGAVFFGPTDAVDAICRKYSLWR